MAGTIKPISSEEEWDSGHREAGTKLVVVDFYATWCGPCRAIAPKVAEFCLKYPAAVFMKVDVDQVPDLSEKQGITAMPTFKFYRNKVCIDTQRGANPNELEEKIKKNIDSGEDGGEGGACEVKGHMDLGPFINKAGCECLNESDDHTFEHCLTTKGGYLESDCDEQLIVHVQFNQALKLHSLKLQGPADKGPKTVKVFQNQPRTLDFDSADSMEPTQLLELSPEDLKEGSLVQLRYVKFQNVGNITLFIKDNQAGEETTQLDYLGFIGTPVSTTNMSDFKRVAGKKGESH